MGSLTSHRDGPLLTLALSNPGKANALDLEMLAALDAAIDGIEADPQVRRAVLRAHPFGRPPMPGRTR